MGQGGIDDPDELPSIDVTATPRRSASSLGPMTTLSARSYGLLKYALPFIAVLGACAWTYWSDIRHGKQKSLSVYLFGAVVLTIIAVFVFRRGLWSMADTVEYSGDVLYVRRRKTTESIPLSDIRDVTWENGVVTVELGRANSLGAIIRFYGQSPRKVPNIADTLESLAARVRTNGRPDVA